MDWARTAATLPRIASVLVKATLPLPPPTICRVATTSSWLPALAVTRHDLLLDAELLDVVPPGEDAAVNDDAGTLR